MAGTFSLWNTSLFYTNVASAAMIGNISPLWVSLAAWVLLREGLRSQFWIGLLVLLLGIGRFNIALNELGNPAFRNLQRLPHLRPVHVAVEQEDDVVGVEGKLYAGESGRILSFEDGPDAQMLAVARQ